MMEVRRSMTLSDHMSRSAANGDNTRVANPRSQTLRETFAAAANSRTLMDIIREEHAISRGEFPLNGDRGGVSWRAFKDRLRLRRTSADRGEDDEDEDIVIGLPTSPVFGRAIAARLNQARMPGAVTLRERIDSDYAPTAADSAEVIVSTVTDGSLSSAVEEEQTERVSLMALLGQSDPEAGSLESEELEAAEEVETVDEVGGEMKHVCCVCMVRHKGAAFIPCGHTFCRLCSRELWVSRGNCPLCNGYILEILDIF